MDSVLIPQGVERCSFLRFLFFISIAGAVLLWGGYATLLIWFKGLNQTNMNDYYGFALWIWADLTVIALGGGAFFTGFLKYIVGKNELKHIINYAVLIGFICYSSALLILAIDIGQPLRNWFIFWHANPHSMLTEVAFCLSCYLAVLAIEYIPMILDNRQLGKVPFFSNLSQTMHKNMAIFAGVGAFLSFFHQGSLGGMSGVLYGRPFGFREGLLIWPWTFFLFTWSAAACGPCFTIFITWMTEKITRKRLVEKRVINLLAKISGWMLLTYIIAKIADTVYWALVTVPKTGHTFMDFYQNWFYNISLPVLEIGVFGLLPAMMLIRKKLREKESALVTAVILAILGICLNRWVMVLQVMAAPVMPFDEWALYFPSWQEIATTIMPVAYGAILIGISYRYLPVFPQERILNCVTGSEQQASRAGMNAHE